MRKEFLAVAVVGMLAAAMGSAMEVAEPPLRPRTIGVIQLTAVDQRTLAGFKEGLSARGYRDGESINYLYEGPAGKVDRLDQMITEVLRLTPDLILASSTPATIAAVRATQVSKVPIIFAPVNDPTGAGVVPDLAHPGGHVTGVRLPTGDDLRLQWLMRVAPHVREAFVPYNPNDRSSMTSVSVASKAALELGIALNLQPVADRTALAEALQHLPPTCQAIFLPRDSMVESAIDDIVRAANRRNMPISAPSAQQVDRGATVSYGFRHDEIGERAARLAAQVLQGISPGDIPVESAESWLTINLKAARTIGLDVSDEVLALADLVIRD
jgi:putative ABC transport system substrate-binding protein